MLFHVSRFHGNKVNMLSLPFMWICKGSFGFSPKMPFASNCARYKFKLFVRSVSNSAYGTLYPSKNLNDHFIGPLSTVKFILGPIYRNKWAKPGSKSLLFSYRPIIARAYTHFDRVIHCGGVCVCAKNLLSRITQLNLQNKWFSRYKTCITWLDTQYAEKNRHFIWPLVIAIKINLVSKQSNKFVRLCLLKWFQLFSLCVVGIVGWENWKWRRPCKRDVNRTVHLWIEAIYLTRRILDGSARAK